MLRQPNRKSFWAVCVLAAVILLPSCKPKSALSQMESCMLDVLKATPGVTNPELGTWDYGEWPHPFLEFNVAEKAGAGARRFELQKPKDPINGPFEFMAVVSGLFTPGEKGPDTHVTDVVMQKWEAQCGAHAYIEFP